MSNSSFLPIDRTLSGAIVPVQSGHGGDGNEGVLCIPTSFSITEASSSDYLVLYSGHSLGECHYSAEIQSEHCAVPVDWTLNE